MLFYSSPQVWAWRGGRIHTIAKVVDQIIVLFPFEVPLYAQVGLPAHFLGHPLVGVAASDEAAAALRERIAAPAQTPVVALMPGSRPSELRRHLDILLEAVRRNEAAGLRARYVLPLAPSLEAAPVEAAVRAAGVDVLVVPDGFLPVLRCAQLAVVASGTATLQTALAGIPMVVIYRVSPLSYFIAKRFAYLRHLSMVNILAERAVVPELLQADCTPERISAELSALARDPARQARMREEMLAVTARLGTPGAYERAAAHIAQVLRQGATADAPPAQGTTAG